MRFAKQVESKVQKQSTKAKSHISRVADMLFERNSTRLGRATKLERKTIRASATVRQQYKEKLNSLVCKRRGEKFKKIVLFGDGDFSSSHKGHISMLKKKVLKKLYLSRSLVQPTTS